MKRQPYRARITGGRWKLSNNLSAQLCPLWGTIPGQNRERRLHRSYPLGHCCFQHGRGPGNDDLVVVDRNVNDQHPNVRTSQFRVLAGDFGADRRARGVIGRAGAPAASGGTNRLSAPVRPGATASPRTSDAIRDHCASLNSERDSLKDPPQTQGCGRRDSSYPLTDERCASGYDRLSLGRVRNDMRRRVWLFRRIVMTHPFRALA